MFGLVSRVRSADSRRTRALRVGRFARPHRSHRVIAVATQLRFPFSTFHFSTVLFLLLLLNGCVQTAVAFSWRTRARVIDANWSFT